MPTIDSLVKHLCKALSKNLNQTGLNLKWAADWLIISMTDNQSATILRINRFQAKISIDVRIQLVKLHPMVIFVKKEHYHQLLVFLQWKCTAKSHRPQKRWAIYTWKCYKPSNLKVSSHSTVGTSHGYCLSKTYLKREYAINCNLSFPQLPIMSANYDQKLFSTFFINISNDVHSCVMHCLYYFVCLECFTLKRPPNKALWVFFPANVSLNLLSLLVNCCMWFVQVKYNINWRTRREPRFKEWVPGKVAALERMSHMMHVRTENIVSNVLFIL